MSVAEWFGITFTANTEDAQKKTKDLSKSTDDYAKSANEAGNVSDRLGGSLVGMAAKAAGVITALFSVGAALSGISNAISYADSIGETAEALGLSTEELSAWSDAAKLSGGSAEGLQGSIRALSRDFYQLATTGKSRTQPFFKELGISLLDANGNARDVLDVLPEIAQAMEGMSKQDAIGLGQKLGLDQGTIMLLQQGRRGVEELIARQKELGTVSQQDADTAAAFNDALDDTSHAFRSVYMEIATAILPAFTWVLQKVQSLTQFSREHKTLVVGFFSAIATVLTVFYTPAILKASIATWGMIKPFILIAAPLLLFGALLALIIEDIYAFLNGGDSLIGQLSQKWPIIGKVINGIREAFVWLFEQAEKVINFFSLMWNNPRQALESFKNFLSTAWDSFINSVPGLKAILDTVVKIFETAIASIKATIDAVTNSIKVTKDILSGTNSSAEAEGKKASEWMADVGKEEADRRVAAREAASKLQQAQQLTPVVAGLGVANSSIANSSTTTNSTQVGSVTINTPLNKEEAKAVVRDVMNGEISTANSQIDDGVSH